MVVHPVVGRSTPRRIWKKIALPAPAPADQNVPDLDQPVIGEMPGRIFSWL